MVVMGLTGSWWAAAMLPAALLIAFAFGALGMAVTTFMRTIQDLDMIQVVVLPMFLFSGTFYGLGVYPRWLQIVIECLPLNQGIELLRGLNAGVLTASMIGNVAYFVAMAAVGVTIAARRLDKLLLR
jgi:lipooligosaccharide transport system permease protein